jgi:hypothetical protein
MGSLEGVVLIEFPYGAAKAWYESPHIKTQSSTGRRGDAEFFIMMAFSPLKIVCRI